MSHPARAVVVVPAHNEQELLGDCLSALQAAADAVTVPTELIVVLDACSDATASKVDGRGHCVHINRRNVGAARAAGFAVAGRRCGAETWFATTDADTVVGPDWLRTQLQHAQAGAQLVLGTVTVGSWRRHTAQVRERYLRRYHDVDGHRHVHGANLGIRADTYWAVGGFAALTSSEDVDLVHRVAETGAPVCWTAGAPVRTSSRRTGRAPNGFAAHLSALDGSPQGLVS